METEEKLKEFIDSLSESIKKSVNETCDNYYSEILPHVADDTMHNASYRAGEAIKSMLAGNFKKTTQENTVLVHDGNGVDIPITITSCQYDHIRDNLIKAMPACPKDLKIKSLQEEIKHLENMRRY